MVEILKIDRKPFLIAQKKRPDALNVTQKTPALYKVGILKKIRIPKKIPNFNQKHQKW